MKYRIYIIMNRHKRTTRKSYIFIEEDDEPIIKKVVKPKVQQQQPKQKPQQQQSQVPVPTIPVPTIPVPAIQLSPRILDLGKLPPSNNKKIKANFDKITNEIWVTYFYTPNENITKFYFEFVPEFAISSSSE